MTISEWCKFKRDNEGLSAKDLAVKARNVQRQEIRDFITQQKEDRFEMAAKKTIEQELDKNLDKAIYKALFNGKSKLDIKINM